jgi:NAD(P)H-hydrate epimerase
MCAAGAGVARAVMADFEEIGGFPAGGRVLVLAGKGHNGGDALLAAATVAALHGAATFDVALVGGDRTLKPLAARAWRQLAHAARGRVRRVRRGELAASYDLVLDGVFGFQFRPPLEGAAAAWLRDAAGLSARLRAAVDLPSGLAEPGAFSADFTYATGLVKAPALDLPNAGRLRCLDLGFEAGPMYPDCHDWVLSGDLLAPLQCLRPPAVDKRTFGHLFAIGGSRAYPGAILMSVQAALRSGVGLVTAFVPESLAPAFAAAAPEAMWVGWPETPDGGLAMEGTHLLDPRLDRATALLVGPGLGREPETLAWVGDVVTRSRLPLVLDADALQPDLVRAGTTPRVLTPHAGEWTRIAPALEGKSMDPSGPVLVLKGPRTCIRHEGRTYHSVFGGPVLARGGSGDVLAGLIGGLLAQTPADPLTAACRGVVWHGQAADALARSAGQVAVRTTDLLAFLAVALRARPPR